jgi:hypothetical protein
MEENEYRVGLDGEMYYPAAKSPVATVKKALASHLGQHVEEIQILLMTPGGNVRWYTATLAVVEPWMLAEWGE